MKKLLSLPPNLVGGFHEITGHSRDEYFCSNDPVGRKLGSGGGTRWLLEECHREWGEGLSFDEWLPKERRILLHAGGQSRRLPSYAPSGKILTPIPVFRWERGQRLSQDLLSLELPLYESIMEKAPANIHTMIVSGDVYIRGGEQLPPVPEADVVCYGLWLDADTASHHGVFFSTRENPNVLCRMYQKPSTEELNLMLHRGYYLTDIGVWMLSDRAVKLLMKRCEAPQAPLNSPPSPPKGGCPIADNIKEYCLYSEFGRALGTDPEIKDEELNALTVAIVPLTGGEFYHYGTSREMISSTVRIQNRINDQRAIMHHDRKPHPSIFIQNAICEQKLTSSNVNTWIENSYIGKGWRLSYDNIITGVPRNDWNLTLQPGQCIDIVPIGETDYVVRTYNIDDKFAGKDQQAEVFPVFGSVEEIGEFLVSHRFNRFNGFDENNKIDKGLKENESVKSVESACKRKLSAEQISNEANLVRLFAQRREFRNENWSALADNWEHSVFYQLDLDNASQEFAKGNIPTPRPLPEDAPLLTRISDAMFRNDSSTAFSLLKDGLTETVLSEKQRPVMSVCSDQIVWGRSPVRIDISGGWTDTPPFCLQEGGDVVNLAIELNGQQPLQAYIKPCKERHIVLRSIDLGARETVETYEQLGDFCHVGSPFSIPKAALALAGFLPEFSVERYPTLEAQLDAFGCGIEVTLLSAVPAGSGLGTSSILAATVLGAINDFCALAWGKNAIGKRTLVLEQLLTTGGGWQDQFGGILGGVKLLQTQPGFQQDPVVRWLPDHVFTQPEYAACHLLYYTGITRTAKHILAEIVRRMFLNNGEQIRLLRQMKRHAIDMAEAIQLNDFEMTGKLLRQNWLQNQALDSGSNPMAVKEITDMVDDLCLGYKLPGAGGGGFVYMIAKDPEAAVRIKQTINANQKKPNARFVDMTVSKQGLQVTRS